MILNKPNYCIKIFDPSTGDLVMQLVEDHETMWTHIYEFKDLGLVKIFKLSDDEESM